MCQTVGICSFFEKRTRAIYCSIDPMNKTDDY